MPILPIIHDDDHMVMNCKEMKEVYVMLCSWSELQVWQQGAMVKHVKGLFKAEGISNAAEPGNSMHTRLYVRRVITVTNDNN